MSLLPLAPMQRGFLAGALRSEDPGLEVEQLVLRIPDAEASKLPWQEAWKRTALDFEVLRYRLDRDDSGYGWDCLDEPDFGWSEEALSNSDEALEEWLAEDRQRGINLGGTGPLWRVGLLTGPGMTILIWTVHHILVDGRSFLPVLRSVAAHARGRETEASTGTSYRSFLETIPSLPEDEAETWYRSLFADFDLPAKLEMPRSGKERDVLRKGERRSVYHHFQPAETNRIQTGAEDLGGTLNTLVQTGWSWVLSRLLRSDDVVHGAVRNGRHWGSPSPKDDVGLFISNAPVRSRFSADSTPRSHFEELRRQHIGVRPFEHCAMSSIEEWATGSSGQSLFESFVMFENDDWKTNPGGAFSDFPGASLDLREKTSLPISVVASYGAEGGLTLELDYDSDRFCTSAMTEVLTSLAHATKWLVENPDRLLAETSIVSERQRDRFVTAAADRQRETRWPNLVEAFRNSALHHPDRKALDFGSHSISYAELESKTDQAAQGLVSQGVKAGDVVGLCFSKRESYYPAMLAVIKAGAACLPIDVRLGHATPSVLLSEAGAVALWTDETDLKIPSEVRRIKDPESQKRDGITLPDPGPVAWVLFTSGSTGTPKGVAVPHLGIANYIQFTGEDLGMGCEDRVSQIGSLGFDVSLEEIWLAWAHGASLLPMPAGLHESPDGFSRWIQDQDPTVLDLTTGFWVSMGRAMATGSARVPKSLRVVIVGGEELKAPDYQHWQEQLGERAGEVRLQNTYGPTEASISVTNQLEHSEEYEDALGHLPIGKVLPNLAIDVIDEKGQLLPAGTIGELLISGLALGPGYLNREDDEAFGHRVTSLGEKEWSYATGDLGYLGEGGRFYYLGRIDRETKVRGFRFHPGTVEAALKEEPEVAEAIVHILKDGDEATVVAFLTASSGKPGETLSEELRERLSKTLPPQQMPHRIHFVEDIPLTPNGKVDLRALEKTLPDPETTAAGASDQDRQPASRFEEIVLETASKVLGKPGLGMDQRFHLEGGDSLNSLEWFGLLQSRGVLVSSGFLKEGMTFREFAESLQEEKSRGEESPQRLLPMRVSGKGIPVILPPGAEGNLHYEGWTSGIDREFDLYGLRGDTSDSGHSSFAAMSEDFADALADLPEGSPSPILLGGCYGGFVVQDLAAALTERGDPPAALILVGAHWRARFLSPSSAKETLWQLKSILSQLFRRPFGETRRHISLVWQKAREKLIREKRLGEVRKLGGVAKEIAEQEKEREQANSQLLAEHELRPSPGVPALLVTVRDPRYSLPGDPLDGWGEVLDLLAHHDFPDLDHGDLQKPENEENYAQLINGWLKQTREAAKHPVQV